MHDNPLVSVVTPVYNGDEFLEKCIESVLGQTYQNYEYIIVNNCSKDRTLEIALRYSKLDSRIRVHDNEKFVGVIENHNIAFRMISPKAKYCKVVSADDFLFPDCMTQMVDLAEQHPSVGIVGSYQLSGGKVRWQGFQYPNSVIPGRQIGREVFLTTQPEFPGFGTPTSTLYRADLLRKTDSFYPNPSPHADTSAIFKYLQESDFGFVYQVLSYEQTHAETQSTKSAQMNRFSSASLDDLIQYGPFYLSPDELKTVMARTLKEYRRFLAVNYFTGSRNEEFWNYHKSRLSELGYPLTRWGLIKAAIIKTWEEIQNPGLALKKIRKRRVA